MRTPGFIVPSAGMSMDDMRNILHDQSEKYNFTRFEASLFDDEAVVKHFGVKGMRWGVVREGAKTLALGSDDHVKASVVKAKAKIAGVHTLSNKDLNTIIKRMDLEVKFKELKTIKHNQSLLGKGANWVGRVATDILVTSVASWFKAPWSRGGHASRPSGGFNGRVINGSIVPQRSIGS